LSDGRSIEATSDGEISQAEESIEATPDDEVSQDQEPIKATPSIGNGRPERAAIAALERGLGIVNPGKRIEEVVVKPES
jgi:hypothetical protein